jgi:hypothetical protein
MEELIPWLYLKGVSTGDFSEALAALVGPQAKGLSANTVTRLKAAWHQEYEVWNKRSLADKQYVYVWADGVYFNIRLEDDRQCILVLLCQSRSKRGPLSRGGRGPGRVAGRGRFARVMWMPAPAHLASSHGTAQPTRSQSSIAAANKGC